IVQPTEERQRICRVEMAKPESVEISVPKILQRLLIFAPPPVPFRRRYHQVKEELGPARRMAFSAIAEPSSQSPMKARLIPKPPSDGSFELSARAFWTSRLYRSIWHFVPIAWAKSLRTYASSGASSIARVAVRMISSFR